MYVRVGGSIRKFYKLNPYAVQDWQLGANMAAQGRSIGSSDTTTSPFHAHLKEEDAKAQRGLCAYSGSHSSLVVGLGIKPGSTVCTSHHPKMWPRVAAEQQGEEARLH